MYLLLTAAGPLSINFGGTLLLAIYLGRSGRTGSKVPFWDASQLLHKTTSDKRTISSFLLFNYSTSELPLNYIFMIAQMRPDYM